MKLIIVKEEMGTPLNWIKFIPIVFLLSCFSRQKPACVRYLICKVDSAIIEKGIDLKPGDVVWADNNILYLIDTLSLSENHKFLQVGLRKVDCDSIDDGNVVYNKLSVVNGFLKDSLYLSGVEDRKRESKLLIRDTVDFEIIKKEKVIHEFPKDKSNVMDMLQEMSKK